MNKFVVEKENALGLIDNCSCNSNNTGIMCEIPKCYGIPADDENVCDGKGKCIESNTWKCETGSSGDECKDFTCFEIPSSSDKVSNGAGEC